MAQSLFIDQYLPDILKSLRQHPNLVIQADPGVGKTTRVPPALLHPSVAGDGEILVLEPRRIAARMSAQRIAQELGEPLGKTVGYQIRFEERGSPATKLRFLTEGIFTRKLLSNPFLQGISAVVLDEFHERSVHTDLAIACLRSLQQGVRPDLKIIVMSATMDSERVAKYLGDCPVQSIKGRNYPVEIQYQAPTEQITLDTAVLQAIRPILQSSKDAGHILVFLSGASEINRMTKLAQQKFSDPDLMICPLHANLPPSIQDAALLPSSKRKLIFATNVAETSVTIEGVTTVIDSGLAKISGFSHWSGISTLQTMRISKAAAAQRAGRAGRTSPGRCIRLYSAMDHSLRNDYDIPEILRTDLVSILLQIIALGYADLNLFQWYEKPASEFCQRAMNTLQELDLIDQVGSLTTLGREVVSIPSHPRLAKMLVGKLAQSQPKIICATIALVEEEIKDRNQRSPALSFDILDEVEKIDHYVNDNYRIQTNYEHLLRRYVKQLPRQSTDSDAGVEALQQLLLKSYPDRFARVQASDNDRSTGSPVRQFLCQMGSGEFLSLRLSPEQQVPEFILALQVEERDKKGKDQNTHIDLYCPISPDLLMDVYPDSLIAEDSVVWNKETARIEILSSLTYYRVPVLESRVNLKGASIPSSLQAPVNELLLKQIELRGLDYFVDSEEFHQLKMRWSLFVSHSGNKSLITIDRCDWMEWLRDNLQGIVSLKELKSFLTIETLSAALMNNHQRVELDKQLPAYVSLAGRKRVKVHYESDQDPWIESRIQDFFRMQTGPTLMDGKIPITMKLLAPNHRPIQITQDLFGFWQRHYPSIKKELSRRYPRHIWPENPLNP